MRKLLLCFAHPDDESFATGGTIAKYVADGWDVELLCATKGEAGETGPLGEVTPEELGEIRQKELEKAGEILGISAITFLGYRDGAVKDVPTGELEEAIYQKMMEIVPDVVITFDTLGISNHPDHVRMCYSTTYAFQKYAAWITDQLATVPDATEEVEPRLYYVCLPESLVGHLQAQKSLPAESFGKPWRGVEDKRITTVIDIKDWGEMKKQALEAHVSQGADVQRFLSVPNQPFLSQEHYILRMQGTEEVFMGKSDRVASEL